MTTYPDGGSARHTDPSTSHEAAMQDFTRLEWGVAEAVRLHGKGGARRLCVVEIFGIVHGNDPDMFPSIDYVSPRMKNLVRKGVLIRHPKEPRANRGGKLRKQLVYSYAYQGLTNAKTTTMIAPLPDLKTGARL
jgi:hypothetical protein